MEGNAIGLKAEAMRMLQHIRRHCRIAAELARQRPFGAGAVEQDAAEHLGTGRGAGNLLDLGLAIDGEQPHAERIGARDVALLLDRVAIGDAVRRRAGCEHHLDLGDRGGIEAGAEPGQQRQHLRRRVRLHGIEHPAVRHRLGEGLIVVAHDVEIDDQARPVVTAIAQKITDALSHGALPTKGPTDGEPSWLKIRRHTLYPSVCARRQREMNLAPCRAVETRNSGAVGSSPDDAALVWSGRSRSARPARMDKPLRCRPLEGRRDQKSPFRRCFKPRPPLRTGCAGFASGCRSWVREC